MDNQNFEYIIDIECKNTHHNLIVAATQLSTLLPLFDRNLPSPAYYTAEQFYTKLVYGFYRLCYMLPIPMGFPPELGEAVLFAADNDLDTFKAFYSQKLTSDTLLDYIKYLKGFASLMERPELLYFQLKCHVEEDIPGFLERLDGLSNQSMGLLSNASTMCGFVQYAWSSENMEEMDGEYMNDTLDFGEDIIDGIEGELPFVIDDLRQWME